MKVSLVFKQCVCLGVLGMLITCANGNPPAGEKMIAPKHILFIGNSYTSINGGVDAGLRGLAPGTKTESIASGGSTLESHWKQGTALAAIRKGGWDFVVLQEQSQRPIFERELFLQYVQKFDAEIKRNGGKTILYMTWERPPSARDGVTTANVAAAYNAVGEQLGIKVAPAGLAFARSLALKPDFKLYVSDGHPTNAGTYLASCVLYDTIYDTSPVGNAYASGGIDGATRDYLQRVAAEVTSP